MATGSVDTRYYPNSEGYPTQFGNMRLAVDESWNDATNTSTVTIYLQGRTPYHGNAWWMTGSIVFNGTTIQSNDNSEIPFSGSSSSFRTIRSYGPYTVHHQADGSASVRLKVSGSSNRPNEFAFANEGFYLLIGHGGGSGWEISMHKNAVVSAVSASASTVSLGTAFTIYTNRTSTSLTHRVSYKFVNSTVRTEGLSATTNIGDSVTFTPPILLATLIPNATSAVCTITCETFSGSTSMGSSTTNVTLTVPSSQAPTVTATLAHVSDNATVSGWGIYVQGYSKCAYSVTATAKQSATIKKYAVSIGNYTAATASGTTSVINSFGTVAATFTVTDSRGMSSTYQTTINVNPYSNPVATEVSSFRCTSTGAMTANGQYISSKASVIYSSCGGNNTVSLTMRYKERSAGLYSSEVAMGINTPLVVGDDQVLGTKSYLSQIIARDALGNSTTVEIVIPTASVTFNLKEGGLGAAFGRYADRDRALQIPADWVFQIGEAVMSAVNGFLNILSPVLKFAIGTTTASSLSDTSYPRAELKSVKNSVGQQELSCVVYDSNNIQHVYSIVNQVGTFLPGFADGTDYRNFKDRTTTNISTLSTNKQDAIKSGTSFPTNATVGEWFIRWEG